MSASWAGADSIKQELGNRGFYLPSTALWGNLHSYVVYKLPLFLVQRLLTDAGPDATVFLTSGYFNLTRAYMRLVLGAGASYRIDPHGVSGGQRVFRGQRRRRSHPCGLHPHRTTVLQPGPPARTGGEGPPARVSPSQVDLSCQRYVYTWLLNFYFTSMYQLFFFYHYSFPALVEQWLNSGLMSIYGQGIFYVNEERAAWSYARCEDESCCLTRLHESHIDHRICGFMWNKPFYHY